MNEHRISVIIPTYNRAHLLARAVHSALPQLQPGDEILIVDDASTDDTPALAQSFGGCVRYLRVAHGGAGAARNRGVEAAVNPLIAFLDSDDEWLPGKIQVQRAFMARRTDVLFCFSDFCSKLENGEESHFFLKYWHQDSRTWEEILGPAQMFSDFGDRGELADFPVHVGSLYIPEMESNYVATSTLMVRREEAGAALHFSEDLPISEDKECFGRIARVGPGAYFGCETSIQWGHSGPRVTDLNAFIYETSRIVLLDRIWGQDAEFMAVHGKRVEELKSQSHLHRARWHLVRGLTKEARQDLAAARKSPLSYRLLAAMPGSWARSLLTLRRVLSGKVC